MLDWEVYSIVTIFFTAVWVVLCGKYTHSLKILALAMLLPGFFAPWFSDDPHFWSNVLGIGKGTLALTFAIFGGLLVILILALVSGIDYVTGWGIDSDDGRKSPEASGDLVGGFLRAAGEEIGWRCYLLPQLMKHYSTVTSIFISGVVWGLFHIPVMVFLTRKMHVQHAGRTVFFQFLQCVLQAAPMAWLAVKFSMWGPTIMHLTWNRINPVIFGSVYTQEPGKIRGPQWLINGEGLAGCIALVPFVVVLTMNIA